MTGTMNPSKGRRLRAAGVRRCSFLAVALSVLLPLSSCGWIGGMFGPDYHLTELRVEGPGFAYITFAVGEELHGMSFTDDDPIMLPWSWQAEVQEGARVFLVAASLTGEIRAIVYVDSVMIGEGYGLNAIVEGTVQSQGHGGGQ